MRRVFMTAVLVAVSLAGFSASASAETQYHDPTAVEAPFGVAAADPLVPLGLADVVAPSAIWLADTSASKLTKYQASDFATVDVRSCTETAPRPNADLASKRLITVAFKSKARAVDLEPSI